MPDAVILYSQKEIHMKIIKPGTIPPPRINTKLYRGECQTCHCIVEVNVEELEGFTVNCIGGDKRWVSCPTPNCGNWRLLVELYK